MRFTSFLTASLPMAAFLLEGSLIAKAPEPVTPESKATAFSRDSFIEAQVSDTLREIKTHANQLSVETDRLQSFKMNRGLSRHTHGTHLNAAREHINAIGERLAYLQSVKDASAAWQQRAIETIVPIAAEIADRTSGALNHLNDNPADRSASVYVDHLEAMAVQSELLKQSINPFLDLNETQKRLEAIQSQLDEVMS